MNAPRWDADSGLEELYRGHWSALVRTAYFLLRDLGAAEEVVQEAFVAVHQQWARLRDPDRALPYLRSAVVNRSRSVLRHRVVADKHLRRGLGERLRDAPAATEDVLAGEQRGRVVAALAQLPRRQREVLVLRYYLDLSESEIADTLGVSRGAVKSHASRGSAYLRQLLADDAPPRSSDA